MIEVKEVSLKEFLGKKPVRIIGDRILVSKMIAEKYTECPDDQKYLAIIFSIAITGNPYPQGFKEKLFQNDSFTMFIAKSLFRFSNGDWGDCDEEDYKANDEALINGERLIGAYKHDEEVIWIITESDRSATTILFPEEY